jgi:hypothetical protein
MAMDTSSSPPTEPRPEGREWRVATVAEQVTALDGLVGVACARIRVFDVDLAQGGWDRRERVAALERFLRQPNARLDVILHDTRWIEASAARFVQLLRQFSHAVTVYRTGAEARSAMDPLVIVDERHFLHRFHIDRPGAAVALDMPHAARPLCARFDEIWATGEPGLAGTVLGL